MKNYKPPFVYFGGKSAIADEVWARFGDVPNFIEPFFGSGAVLFARPTEPGTESVNDLDGFLANFWRAVQADPESVARHADWPVNEIDLHARHLWLVSKKEQIQDAMISDPEYFDAKVAGWWCWGLCCWIGSGWCSGNGPWRILDGKLIDARKTDGNAGRGVNRKRPHLSCAGKGVNRQRQNLTEYIQSISNRIENVRVCCGDWSRICSDAVTTKHGITAVFLDPPYTAEAGRDNNLYMAESKTVGHDVCAWAVANGDNPMMRIALCGYEGEYAIPDSWECLEWKTQGGMANQGDGTNDNCRRERIWFSPHCLREVGLFA